MMKLKNGAFSARLSVVGSVVAAWAFLFAAFGAGCSSSSEDSTTPENREEITWESACREVDGLTIPSSPRSVPLGPSAENEYRDITDLPGADPEMKSLGSASWRKLGSLAFDGADPIRLDTGALFQNDVTAGRFNAGTLLFQADARACVNLIAVDNEPIVGTCEADPSAMCYGAQRYARLLSYGAAFDYPGKNFNLPVATDSTRIKFDASYKIEIVNGAQSANNLDIYYIAKKDDDFTKGSIDLNVYQILAFPQDDPYFDDADFLELVGNANKILQKAGVTVREARRCDVVDYALVDKALDGSYSKEWLLTELSRDPPECAKAGVGINLFVFSRLNEADSGDEGESELLGLDGAIPGPGPADFADLDSSGALVSALDGADGGDPEKLRLRLALVGYIIAHELGHYFGLFHTSESVGVSIAGETLGTPICDISNDIDGDNVVDSTECFWLGADHMMFWTVPAGFATRRENGYNRYDPDWAEKWAQISAGEAKVINANVAVE